MRGIISALVVFLLLVVVGSVVLWSLPRVRGAADRAVCESNLTQIGIALHNHEATRKHFPQAAMPNSDYKVRPEDRLSWLVVLLPYETQEPFSARLDHSKPWDSEENRFMALSEMRINQCPGFRPTFETTWWPTSYIGVGGIGPDAAFLSADDPCAGFFGYDRTLSASDILINCSGELIVVIESARVRGAWTSAGPATVRGWSSTEPQLGAGREFGGNHQGVTNCLFADGHVQAIPDSTPSSAIEPLLRISRSSDGKE